jgi:CheY-like chemotaxis protein
MAESPVTILLVEDDLVDVMNVRRAFAKNNLSNVILEARNGIEALELLRSGVVPKRHVVLLDLNTPRMTGIEFLAVLRADPELKTTSVVVLTTSNEERDKRQAYALNVASYLVKPVSFSNFVELVAALNTYWTLVELP